VIVRELVAKFGLDFDETNLKRASSGLEGLKSLAGKVGLALSAGAIAKGLYSMVELAASASENLSLMKVTFGESTNSILKWAEVQSKTLGRSEYTLRKYAASIGVVAKGLTGSEKEATTVGVTFSQLAVDLKAFFDLSSDEEALNALRSGITGETEPLKRLGIVMDDAALSTYALQKGHETLWKDMTAAEKTMVRFNFIMSSSTVKDAWGASAREADSFGNRVAALTDRAMDLATKLGEKLLPAAQKILDILDKLMPIAGKCADAIGFLAEETYAFEVAAGIAAAVGGVKFIGMLVNLYRTIRTRVLLAFVSMFMNLAAVTAWLGVATTATWAFIVAWAPVAAIIAAVVLLGVAIYALWETFTTGTNFIAEWTEEWWGLQSDIVTGLGIIEQWFTETWKSISEYVSGVLESIRKKIAEILPQSVLNALATVGIDLTGAATAASSHSDAGKTAAPGATVASRNVSVTNGAITVNVNGNATPGTANAVGKEVQRALDQNNRNLAQTAPGAPA
jgi:hypothetical protein